MFFHMVYKSGQIFLPFSHNSRVWRTDRQTDRILTAIPRLHYMQRGKNKKGFLQQMFTWFFHSRYSKNLWKAMKTFIAI